MHANSISMAILWPLGATLLLLPRTRHVSKVALDPVTPRVSQLLAKLNDSALRSSKYVGTQTDSHQEEDHSRGERNSKNPEEPAMSSVLYF